MMMMMMMMMKSHLTYVELNSEVLLDVTHVD
jgi:hypothetical protein